MLYVTDNELVEGVFGGIAVVIFIRYYEKYLLKSKLSIPLSGFIGWMLFWWTRKMLMNVYKELKKKYRVSDKIYDIF
jgi:hypothetical protein